jgi:hypothetical protein
VGSPVASSSDKLLRATSLTFLFRGSRAAANCVRFFGVSTVPAAPL